jgi:hypothetical protein
MNVNLKQKYAVKNVEDKYTIQINRIKCGMWLQLTHVEKIQKTNGTQTVPRWYAVEYKFFTTREMQLPAHPSGELVYWNLYFLWIYLMLIIDHYQH